jgi:hypothetical protein
MTGSRIKQMSDLGALHARAKALNLHGLLAHWAEATAGGWVEALLNWEEQERAAAAWRGTNWTMYQSLSITRGAYPSMMAPP